MIPLIITVCLVAQPAQCKDVDSLARMTPVACQIMGQMGAKEWLDDHPKWRLRGWHCRYGAPERKA